MATGTYRDDRSLSAATTVVNILSGSLYEFLQRPTGIAIYAVADPASGAPSKALMTLLLGQAIILQDYPIPNFTALQGPNRDQHLIKQVVGAGGDRVVVTLRNPDAAIAWNIRTLIEFT